MKRLKTIFGVKGRPHRDRKGAPPRLEVVVETPQYDLIIFKIHFGKLTLKVYTKGERVLRFEAIVHNTKELRCGRVLDRFPIIVIRLQQILDRFMTTSIAWMQPSSATTRWINSLHHPRLGKLESVASISTNHARERS